MARKKIAWLLICAIVVSAYYITSCDSESDERSDLWITLRTQDSLLFDVGFNTCDIAMFEKLVAEDMEFYHDQSGITPSKDEFLRGTREGLCALDYQPIRTVENSSLRVFPMKNNGELYGGIQTGHHYFYAKYSDREELILTSEADFTHLWILVNNEWKLSRVLSYNHIPHGE